MILIIQICGTSPTEFLEKKQAKKIQEIKIQGQRLFINSPPALKPD